MGCFNNDRFLNKYRIRARKNYRLPLLLKVLHKHLLKGLPSLSMGLKIYNLVGIFERGNFNERNDSRAENIVKGNFGPTEWVKLSTSLHVNIPYVAGAF